MFYKYMSSIIIIWLFSFNWAISGRFSSKYFIYIKIKFIQIKHLFLLKEINNLSKNHKDYYVNSLIYKNSVDYC
jgi:hypothetical protein